MKITYIATAPVYITNERGNTKVLQPGAEISAFDFNCLKPAVHHKFVRKEVAVSKERWLKSDLRVVLDVYLKYTVGDQSAVGCEDARVEVLERVSGRTPSSINMVFCQIRGLDASAPQEGLEDTSKTLIDLCHAADSNRFPVTGRDARKMSKKLDLLLAEIRG